MSTAAPATVTPWQTPQPYESAPVIADAEAYALAGVYRTLIGIGAATATRTLQRTIGSSELGYACDRRLAYRLSETPVTNTRDPLVTLLGTGWHAAMAETFARINGLTGGRFLVEQPVMYRDIPGQCDLYDKTLATVVDWKSSTLDKISHLKRQGPALPYQVQVQCYASGLIELGHDVRNVALVFVPRDGKTLDQIWVWRTKYDRKVADDAIDRLEALRGKAPQDVPATPDRLCPWCSHYLPGSTDLSVGCPGNGGGSK